MSKDFLLEIGTEEIPARFMPGALKELKEKAEEILKRERLIYKEVTAYGTPRRLVLYIKDLHEVGEGLVEEKKGPSAKAAFDVHGNYTKAAEGFARSQGVSLNELIIKETQGGSYLFAIIKQEGKNIRELFPNILPGLILSLDFPKTMRWSYLNIRFVRPIRWLLCLYGEDVIPLEIEGVASDRLTWGHRFLGQGRVEVTDVGSFFNVLKEQYVIVNQHERKELVWKQINELAAGEGGRVEPDPELLEEITYLLEYPTALCGNYNSSYLELPQEVLITVMKEHQKYFPLWEKSSAGLLPKFITVRNGDASHLAIVAAGNEKVLEARLNDAKFFYKEDVKTKLEDKLMQLKSVVFQEKLGTMYQRVQRIQQIAHFLSNKLGLSPLAREQVSRAAHLAKADLVSNMVYEFPELQGIMGYYYALYYKEVEEVALAIKEHYQPRYAGDDLPVTTAGTVVAISDKIDVIGGCFATGIRPTGSGDPYALRRQAYGICLIISAGQLDIKLPELIKKTLEVYELQGLKIDKEEVISAVLEFFKQRLANLLEEKGINYDVVNCVLDGNWDNITETLAKAQALMEFKSNSMYEELITAYTRAANLGKNATTSTLNESLFAHAAEKILWERFKTLQEKSCMLWNNRLYADILEGFVSLKYYIDDYFEKVMVMDKDEAIKNNRLAMLKALVDYLKPFGDLSKLL
ncbi:MAG: glycine--tRNA ligase subunit beta [Bacillota bacterium]